MIRRMPLVGADQRPVDLEVVEVLGVHARHHLGVPDVDQVVDHARWLRSAASFQPSNAATITGLTSCGHSSISITVPA